MALCPHCSNEIDDGARFCGVCGRPITPTAGASVAARGGGKDNSGSFPRPLPSAVPTQVPPAPSASTSGVVPAPAPAARSAPTAAAARPAPAPAPAARPAPAPAAAVPPVIRGPQQPLENLIGRTLNHRYMVEDKIGEGGFGAVFRGKQIATG